MLSFKPALSLSTLTFIHKLSLILHFLYYSGVSAFCYALWICHSFPSKEQVSFKISWLQSLSEVILEPRKNKTCHCFHFFPIYLPWSDGTRCHDLSFFECWVLSQLFHCPFLPSSWASYFLFILCRSVQFSSVAQSCPTLCGPVNRSMPGLPVHHQLLESTQTHVHRVNDAIQPSHPLSSPSPPALSLSPHQGLFQWVSSLHEVAKVLEFQLQHQPFQWTSRTDLP